MAKASHDSYPMSANILRMPEGAVNRPAPDRAQIERSLKFFMSLSAVAEIRGLGVSSRDFQRPHTAYGYFDDPRKAAEAAFTLGRTDGNVYVLLNPVNSALLARATNRIKVAERSSTASDADIIRRQLVLLDFDPTRPSGISSTEDEKEAARQKALAVRQHLAELGWPNPIFADSGNGYHLLYRVDLPNDAESTALVKSFLVALDAVHGEEQVKIDTSVHNAARIVKLYGTVARKGDHTSERPHRKSLILELPEQLGLVPGELIRHVAGMLPPRPPKAPAPTAARKVLDIEPWLSDHGLEAQRVKPWQGGTLIVIDCPFNEDHRGSYHVEQFPNGAISAGCLHKSCDGNDWDALRDRVEPGWRKRPRLSGGDLNKSVKQFLADIASDPGAAFSAEFIEAMAILQLDDEQAWARARQELRENKKIEWTRLKGNIATKAKELREERRLAERGSRKTGIESNLVIPDGYSLTENTTVRICRGRDGEDYEKTIAFAPVTITAALRDAEQNCEFVRLEYKSSGRPNHVVAERGTALNSRKLIELASNGFPVASDNANELAAYLHALEACNRETLPRYKVSSHLGWQGRLGSDGFLLGRALIRADGLAHTASDLDELFASGQEAAAGVFFRGLGTGDEQIADGFHTGGTFEGWVDVARRVEPYNRVLVGLYASFVPPLLEILKIPNFVIDWCCRTSTGKTTTQRVAGSVWGRPDERAADSVIHSWDATKVFIERASAVLSGLPLILDDTKRAKDSRLIAETLYLVANGKGRGRGNTKSLARSQAFRTVLLSSGEAPATSFTEDGGTRTRCLEVRGLPFGAENERTIPLVSEVNLNLQTHYGHAGQRFVRYLLQHRDCWDEWAEQHRQVAREYIASATGEQARMAQYAAAIVIAGRIAHEALDLPWAFRDPCKGRCGLKSPRTPMTPRGAERALMDVKSWADSHQEWFFGRARVDRDGNAMPPGTGWAGRWDKENWEFIGFYPTRLKEILRDCGYEPEAILATWKERKWLELEEGRPGYTKRFRVGGEQPYLIAVGRAAFGELERRKDDENNGGTVGASVGTEF
jgi:putative DNA primase/helicase